MAISRIENEELSLQIYQACKDAGYDDCGIISIDDMEGYILNVNKRVEAVPDSAGFYHRAIESTRQLKENYPWADSIVICLSWFGKYRFPEELRGMYAKSFFISRNSDKNGPEYQKKHLLGKWFDEHNILWDGPTKNGGNNIYGVRHAAETAGLGIVRRNNFFYNEQGSWIELDAYIISESCRLYHKEEIPPCPKNCNICQKACPTSALSAPHTLNPRYCVSTINTFSRSILPEGIREEQLGSWLIGCEACQDACPYNRKHDWSKGENYSGLDELIEFMQPENILEASEEELFHEQAEHRYL